MTNKELEQWYSFCEKCDKYIEEQKTGYYRHILESDIYWPICKVRILTLNDIFRKEKR